MFSRLSLVLFSLLLGTTAFAQPFQVLGVAPSSGPTTGGTQVTIRMNQLPNCPILPPSPTVRFGAVSVVAGTNGVDSFVVNSPAHAAGSVGLTINACGMDELTVANGFTYVTLTDPDYEKVLLPVLFFGAGAHGSLWATNISVYNAGVNTIVTPNAQFAGGPACPAVCGCGPIAQIPPRSTADVCGLFADPAGLILYMPKSSANDLHYHARAVDTSRSTANAGTEIPVVREREFRTDAIHLQNLQLDEQHFRLGLRVFNPDQHDGAQVRLEVLDTRSIEVYGEHIITLSYPIRNIVPDPYPNRPAYANLGDLDRIVREILGTRADSIDRFHLRLTPVTPNIRIWAFATITNNETQLITTVSPQY